MVGLEFELVETGETGRLRYDAREMKLEPYGYVQQVRSSRRLDLENECRRNLEVIWLPNGLPLELLSGYFLSLRNSSAPKTQSDAPGSRNTRLCLRITASLRNSLESRPSIILLFFYSLRCQNVGENAWLMTG
jgi:hypothetical protein